MNLPRIRLILGLAASGASAQQFVISTFAGGAPGATPVGALNVTLTSTESVVADGSGNIYFTTSQSLVLKVDSKGVLTRVAGNGRAGFSGDGGPATQAALSFIAGDINDYAGGALAIDGSGNLYIADSANHRIRKISTDGSITTIAGTGDSSSSMGDGGPAVNAAIPFPIGIAVDPGGNIYVSDLPGDNIYGTTDKVRIRKITPDGTINAVPATSGLNFQGLVGLATDAQGNLYIADLTGHRVLERTTDGVIHPIAGNGSGGFSSGDGGPAIAAQLAAPLGMAVDAAGDVYIADSGANRLYKVTPDGIIHTLVGMGVPWAGSTILVPYAVALDGAGNVLIADSSHGLIRSLSPGGVLTTIAGGGVDDGGPAANAQFNFWPWGGSLATDNRGDLYIADTGNLRIRMISAQGIVNTVAGTGANNDDEGDGGPALKATINYPYGVAVDNAGNFYLADGNIREVSANGIIETVANTIVPPVTFADRLASDGNANIYITSPNGVDKLAPNGSITNITSQTGWAIVSDTAGNIYLSDIFGFVVRKIAIDGTVTVVAGNGTPGFSGDGGSATSAQLNTPTALAIDAIGNLYIADCFNYRIRIVSTAGIIFTIAGNGNSGYSGDGGVASNAQMGLISGIAVDSTGNLYLADQTYNAIRLVQWEPAVPAKLEDL